MLLTPEIPLKASGVTWTGWRDAVRQAGQVMTKSPLPVITNLHAAGFAASPGGPQRSGGGAQRLDTAKHAVFPAPVPPDSGMQRHGRRPATASERANLQPTPGDHILPAVGIKQSTMV